ncbi:40S ribosomal protein S12, mitochondrial [Chelonus insularis]|uniref:40S ribosomal protein S12, mitochondrial n=1 Tax=Chelonus insularis TaxID=460826 RepID=UPI00158B2EB5|nr:40S ribosomal protein S12, mitochondrial [Chelonus insularis]
MSIIARGFINLFKSNITKCVEQAKSWSLTKSCVENGFSGFTQFRNMSFNLLYYLHKKGPPRKRRRYYANPLGRAPQAKGVVLKTLIKKPKKPNSANRKCVLVRLSNGKELVAYVPGIGHNLQEHNIVLVRVGRLQDTPGVKLKCVRGKYDLPHVIKPGQ